MNFVAEAGSFVNKQDPNADPKAKDAPQVQDVMCVEFLANGNIVTGMASGDIYLWKPMAETHGMQVGAAAAIARRAHKHSRLAHTHTHTHTHTAALLAHRALSRPLPPFPPSFHLHSATRSS